MKFILNKDTLEVDEVVVGNSGSVNYYEAEVEYDESWNNLNIEAVLVKKDDDVGTSIAVINNKFFIDKKLYGSYCIGFVGYTIENDKKTYQISSNLKYIHFDKGAGQIETENEELPTPTEWEIYIAQIKELISGITSIPSGGTTGQALVKKSDVDNDFEWKTIQGGGGTADHSQLDNLDYENSGHTGFQRAGNYIEDSNYVHTDNNFDNTYKSNVDNNTVARHIHENKAVLDEIKTTDIANWNNKAETKDIPTNLSELVEDEMHRTVTDTEKQTWNNKYDNPNNGIPKTDLASDVQNSLEKANSALQQHQDISDKEDRSNKVTSINASSTDDEYPSAKCVYDIVGDIETLLGGI